MFTTGRGVWVVLLLDLFIFLAGRGVWVRYLAFVAGLGDWRCLERIYICADMTVPVLL